MARKFKDGIGRRRLLQGAAGIAGAALGSGVVGAPVIWAQNNKNIVLRQFGTGVSNINEIAEKCKADLGITLQMTALDSDAVVQRAVTQPNSYDIADIEYWMVKKVFPANVLQPMNVKKIKYFDKIVPIFTKGGCNGGGCHGKSGGQNGFRLSLLGFEPQEDYEHLVKEARGRRVFAASPEQSLLLMKAANVVPHGGGLRLEPSSDGYRILRAWLQQGTPNDLATAAKVVALDVQPAKKTLKPKAEQQLKVTARFADGKTRDVTSEAYIEIGNTEVATGDAGDWDRWADLHTEDGVWIEHHLGTFHGRDCSRSSSSRRCSRIGRCSEATLTCSRNSRRRRMTRCIGTPTSASAWVASITEDSSASGTTSATPDSNSFSASSSSRLSGPSPCSTPTRCRVCRQSPSRARRTSYRPGIPSPAWSSCRACR